MGCVRISQEAQAAQEDVASSEAQVSALNRARAAVEAARRGGGQSGQVERLSSIPPLHLFGRLSVIDTEWEVRGESRQGNGTTPRAPYAMKCGVRLKIVGFCYFNQGTWEGCLHFTAFYSLRSYLPTSERAWSVHRLSHQNDRDSLSLSL